MAWTKQERMPSYGRWTYQCLYSWALNKHIKLEHPIKLEKVSYQVGEAPKESIKLEGKSVECWKRVMRV